MCSDAVLPCKVGKHLSQDDSSIVETMEFAKSPKSEIQKIAVLMISRTILTLLLYLPYFRVKFVFDTEKRQRM